MLKRAKGITGRLTILFLVVLAAFFLFPGTSSACSPPRGLDFTPFTLEEKVNIIPVILQGKVIDNQIYKVTVKVQHYFKGSGPAEVTIRGFDHGADCLFIAPDGESIYYVWASPDKTLGVAGFFGSPYITPMTGRYVATDSYSPELATGLIKATGHQPVPPDLDLFPWFIWGGAGLVVIIVGLGGLFLLRKRRNS